MVEEDVTTLWDVTPCGHFRDPVDFLMFVLLVTGAVSQPLRPASQPFIWLFSLLQEPFPSMCLYFLRTSPGQDWFFFPFKLSMRSSRCVPLAFLSPSLEVCSWCYSLLLSKVIPWPASSHVRRGQTCGERVWFCVPNWSGTFLQAGTWCGTCLWMCLVNLCSFWWRT